VGRYLLTVRAEHLFLLTLIYTYTEDYKGVQSEYEEFRRYILYSYLGKIFFYYQRGFQL
jgi:hypothetical protein